MYVFRLWLALLVMWERISYPENCLGRKFNKMLEGVLWGLCWPSMTLHVASRGLVDPTQESKHKHMLPFLIFKPSKMLRGLGGEGGGEGRGKQALRFFCPFEMNLRIVFVLFSGGGDSCSPVLSYASCCHFLLVCFHVTGRYTSKCHRVCWWTS